MPNDLPTLNGSRDYRYKYVIVSERALDIDYEDPNTLFVTASDFIANKGVIDLRRLTGVKIINLCSSFDYLSKGYYCSLMAEARGHRCIPGVSDMISLQWKRHYQTRLPELNLLVDKYFKAPDAEPTSYKYTVYFGRMAEESLEPLGRKLFDLFRFPMISVEIKLDAKGKWTVESVAPVSLNDLPKHKHENFLAALKKFTGTAWRAKSERRVRHWVGLLHDPLERTPPSNKGAIHKFIRAAKDMNITVECITKNDYPYLLEYDGLFIRETTAINHHTYRFAAKAEEEGIPCIDDAQSIIRCCNKVFQYELLESKKIPLPATTIVDRRTEKMLSQELSYPVVVKIPDGAFSRGVVKAESPEEFRAAAGELLKKSEVVLAQEFVVSDYDWRIGVLDGEALFACRYYMAEGHWQIYNHRARTMSGRTGRHETVGLQSVPQDVVATALRAARLIGTGLYGVDLKISGDRIIVMEVNDNPTIDAGIEDEIAGDIIYQRVIASLLRRIESAGEAPIAAPAPTPAFKEDGGTGTAVDATILRPYQQRATGARG